jgi:hypothetical protein
LESESELGTWTAVIEYTKGGLQQDFPLISDFPITKSLTTNKLKRVLPSIYKELLK